MNKYITLFRRRKYNGWYIAEEQDINHPFSKEIYEFKEINIKHEHILKAYLNDDVTIKFQTTTGIGGAPIVQICSDFVETYNENNIYIIDRVNNEIESDQLYQDICILVDEVSNNLDYKKMYEQSEELNKKYVGTIASLNERVEYLENFLSNEEIIND